MRVTDISGGYVYWRALDSTQEGSVRVENWERRYRPFTAPTEGASDPGSAVK